MKISWGSFSWVGMLCRRTVTAKQEASRLAEVRFAKKELQKVSTNGEVLDDIARISSQSFQSSD